MKKAAERVVARFSSIIGSKVIVWYHDHANKKVAAFPEQRLKLSKSTVFLVLKTMGIGGFFKNFGKSPKMAHFGPNLA